MDFIEINKLAHFFKITEEECHSSILKIGNRKGVKLLHRVGLDVIIPRKLYENCLRVVSNINESLVSYEVIKENKLNLIPFTGSGWVYFLFNNEDLIYIGQTINLAARIGSHKKHGKTFNQVSVVPTNPEDLLLMESFYIYRDFPSENVTVMSSQDYFESILNLVDIEEV